MWEHCIVARPIPRLAAGLFRTVDRLTARQLFDSVGERLALRWVAGMRGENRAIETGGSG